MLIEKTVDRESQQKLYVQMYAILKQKIEHGEWPSGSQIPTEDELCRCYDVSKATVRMAIADLVRSGYLRKQQGRGTFVISTVVDLGITMKTRLTEDMFGEGVKARKEIVEKGVRAPTDEMRSVLNVYGEESEHSLYYILCKRLVNGEPAYLEESYVRYALFPSIEHEDVCQKPFYDLIQEKGEKKIFKVVQTIEVSEVEGNSASLLRVREGTPALLLHRLLIGSDSRPIAYTRLLGVGRQYKIQTEFERINKT